MLKLVDVFVFFFLVILAILIGFIAKLKKWRVKWKDHSEKKRNLVQRIDELDGELDLDEIEVTETDLINQVTSNNSKLVSHSPSVKVFKAGYISKKNGEITIHKPSFLINAISLVIGFQTSTSIVGLPLEFYYYGARSYQFALCVLVSPIIISMFFIPFLYKLKTASIYDYLDDKFAVGSKKVILNISF